MSNKGTKYTINSRRIAFGWLLEIKKRKHLLKSVRKSYYLLSYNPNILETLNRVLTLSLIYPFVAFSEGHQTCFDNSRSVMPLLAASEVPPAERLFKSYFSGFTVDLVIFKKFSYSRIGMSLCFWDFMPFFVSKMLPIKGVSSSLEISMFAKNNTIYST